MLYLAVDSDGTENLFINEHPIRRKNLYWDYPSSDPNYLNYRTKDPITLPMGTIERLVGIKLEWNNEPIELDPEIPLRDRVIINQNVLDYINSGNGLFDYVPDLNSVWEVVDIKIYKNVNNGEPVLELEDRDGNWLRFPKDLFDKYK